VSSIRRHTFNINAISAATLLHIIAEERITTACIAMIERDLQATNAKGKRIVPWEWSILLTVVKKPSLSVVGCAESSRSKEVSLRSRWRNRRKR
jgi:hypothetical protein